MVGGDREGWVWTLVRNWVLFTFFYKHFHHYKTRAFFREARAGDGKIHPFIPSVTKIEKKNKNATRTKWQLWNTIYHMIVSLVGLLPVNLKTRYDFISTGSDFKTTLPERRFLSSGNEIIKGINCLCWSCTTCNIAVLYKGKTQPEVTKLSCDAHKTERDCKKRTRVEVVFHLWEKCNVMF